MNVIGRLEFELAYYDSAVHRFNHEDTPTLLYGQDKLKIPVYMWSLKLSNEEPVQI